MTARRALTILDKISAAVLSEDLPTALGHILEAACSCTGAEEGSVFVLDYVRDELQVCSSKGIEDKGFQRLRLQVGDRSDPINLAFDQGGPVIQRGISYAKGRAATSLISIPILAGKSRLGVLCACRQNAGLFPTAVEQSFLTTLANFAALAIENHRQSEEAALNSAALSAAVEWGKSPEPLLQKVVDSALKVAGAQAVILYEYDEEAEDVRMPPHIAGTLQHQDILLEKGRTSQHRSSVVFQMLRRKRPFYATNAPKDWLDKRFYQSREELERSFLGREEIESSAAVPLWMDERPVGVLFINYHWPQVFGPGLKRRIELFAGQAAIAIWNSRRSERHAKNLDLLQQIGHAINAYTAEDITSLCELVHQQVGRLMEARNFIVCLYDEDSKTCKPCYMKDEKDKLEDFAAEQWNSGLCAEVCRTGIPLLRNEETTRHGGAKLIGARAASWLGVPMKAGGRVIGSIALQSYSPSRVYTKEHKALLSSLAAQTAVAVNNYLTLTEAYQEIQELTNLCESAEDVALSRYRPQELLKKILKSAVRALHAEGGIIFRYDPIHQQLPVECAQNFTRSSSRSLRWGEGVTGRAVEQQTTLLQDDYMEWPDRVPELAASEISDRVSSVLAAALIADGKVLGALTLMAGKDHPFTLRDKEMVNRFARLAEIAFLRKREPDPAGSLRTGPP